MAITRGISFKYVPANATSSPVTSGATPSAITAGSCVVVMIRSAQTAGAVNHQTTDLSDSIMGSYTFVAKYEGSDPNMYLYYIKNHSGGSPTFTDTFSNPAGTAYEWIYVQEYKGADTTAPLDTTGTGATAASTVEFVSPGGNHTNWTTSAFSNDGATDSAIIVAYDTNNFESYTAGTVVAWNLLDGSIGNIGGTFGGIEDFILSGSAWTTTAADINSGSYNSWTTGRAVIKAAAAGGGTLVNPPTLMLTGVQ